MALMAYLGLTSANTPKPIADGDYQILHYWVSENGLSYTAEELLNFLKANFSEEDFNELETALLAGDVNLGELKGGGPVATHDKTTIAIKSSEWPLWICALALWHEWEHIENIDPNAGKHAKDPLTDGPCSNCEHLSMLILQLKRIAHLDCEGILLGEDVCGFWEKAYQGATEINSLCRYEGAGCGYSGQSVFGLLGGSDGYPCNCQ